MKLRVLAFALAILAFFLFVGSPFQQSANAVALIDDAIIAIIVAALAGMGITFSYTGGYYTLYDWIQSELIESGISLNGLQAGSNSIGNILLNNRFVVLVTTFASYITNKYQLSHNSTQILVQSNYGVYDELSGASFVPGIVNASNNWVDGTILFYVDMREYNAVYTNDYYYRINGVYYKIHVDKNGTVAGISSYYSDDMEEWTKYSNDIHIGGNTGNYNRNYRFEWLLQNNEIWFCMYVGQNQYGGIADTTKIFKVAGVALGQDLSAVTDVINIPSDTQDKSGIIDIPVPWGTTFTEAVNDIPSLSDDDELGGNTTLTLDSNAVIESQLDNETTNADYVSSNVSDYQTPGLQSVFPFCIPFDLYNFVACLAADPVAPSFTWRFYVPGICDESIEIDLSEFDAAAQVLRTMELLLFCVGLAFVTRKIIRG